MILGGITMKRGLKRFFSTIIAVTMMLSSTLAVSAAEPDNSSTVDNGAIVSEVESRFIDYVPSEYSVMPLSTSYLNYSSGTMSSNAKFTDNFTLSRDERLVVKFNVTGKCRIVVKLKDGLLWTTYMDETVTNDQLWQISNATFNQGWKIEVAVTSLQNYSKFSLQMWGE